MTNKKAKSEGRRSPLPRDDRSHRDIALDDKKEGPGRGSAKGGDAIEGLRIVVL